jgi:hypothetical protein
VACTHKPVVCFACLQEDLNRVCAQVAKDLLHLLKRQVLVVEEAVRQLEGLQQASVPVTRFSTSPTPPDSPGRSDRANRSPQLPSEDDLRLRSLALDPYPEANPAVEAPKPTTPYPGAWSSAQIAVPAAETKTPRQTSPEGPRRAKGARKTPSRGAKDTTSAPKKSRGSPKIILTSKRSKLKGK